MGIVSAARELRIPRSLAPPLTKALCTCGAVPTEASGVFGSVRLKVVKSCKHREKVGLLLIEMTK